MWVSGVGVQSASSAWVMGWRMWARAGALQFRQLRFHAEWFGEG
jgi:hypothetical protein